ncbi:hypothetical protein AK812_SmicGene38225 [Symbiodinium microadriaticum]|uniref:Uncharacterized protein n=1 Tax=Symbiodinium microadriaticum TaxID=2951 RepID=A0A1Q9CED5_SYMMI|nr:hypothetical protein AK812_SmicGene38225 [Symbiodinium microadriaticum]
MIKVPSVAALMLKMDHDYGHDAPLNGIVAMQGLVSKTRTEEMLQWVVGCIDQYFECGYLVKGELTTRQINPAGGTKGTVDLFMYKKDISEHLLGGFLDELVDDHDIRREIRKRLASHSCHHNYFGWPRDAEATDLTWYSAWAEGCREVLSYGAFETLVQELKSAIEKDRKASGQELPGTAPAAPAQAFKDATDIPEHILSASLDDLDSDEDKILKYRAMAMHEVKTRIKLIVEPSSDEAFATAIADTSIGQLRGDSQKKILCLYDIRKSGESVTAPHLRPPSFRKEHAQKGLRAVMASRGRSEEMHEGDVFFVYDAGKMGNERAISSLLSTNEGKRIGHDKRMIFLTYTEVEILYIFTKSNLELAEAKHPIYGGSTAGNLVGPIQLESFQDCAWQTTFEEKKKMLGSFRVAVGGTTDGADSTPRPMFKNSELKYKKQHGAAESCDGEYEPFSFHGLPCDYYKDMMRTWNPKCIVDLTAGDLAAAFVAIELKLPYLGVMFSEKHLTEGYKHIADMTFRAMSEESSPLYEPKLAALLNPGGTDNAKGRGRGRGKGRGRGQNQQEGTGTGGNNQEEVDVLHGGGSEGQVETQTPGSADAGGSNANANESQGGSGSEPKKKKQRTGTASASGPAGGGNQTSLDHLMNQLKTLRSGK